MTSTSENGRIKGIFTVQEEFPMMYIHYCTHCDRIHMLNGHKTSCAACGQPLKELSVSFLEFTNMDAQERDLYQEKCRSVL